MNNDTGNAEHPFRQSAIKIIEHVIEPLLGDGIMGEGLAGEKYYEVEDAIVAILEKEITVT